MLVLNSTGCHPALTLLAENAPGGGGRVAAGAVLEHCAVLQHGTQEMEQQRVSSWPDCGEPTDNQ